MEKLKEKTLKYNLLKKVTPLLIFLTLSSCSSKFLIDSKLLIGKWYLEKEENPFLIFDRKSNLYGNIEEVKNNGPEKSIEFISLTKLNFSNLEFDMETFEIAGGSSIYEYHYNQKKKLLVSDVSKMFNCQKLKLYEVTENKLIFIKK